MYIIKCGIRSLGLAGGNKFDQRREVIIFSAIIYELGLDWRVGPLERFSFDLVCMYASMYASM